MNALAPLQSKPETVKGLLHAVAMGTVVQDVVKEQVDRLRGNLQAEVERLSEETGAAFTARVGGIGSALLTDPQPKATVSDELAFGRWLAEHADPDGALGLWVACERVEIHDHLRVAAALSRFADGKDLDAADELAAALDEGAIEVVLEHLPSETALDQIILKRWVAIRFDRDVETWTAVEVDEDGEPGREVPGVRVACGKPTLQVRLDPAGRKQAAADIRAELGLPELEGGA